MMRRSGLALLTISALLGGCVSSSAYRVQDEHIYQPQTRAFVKRGRAMTAIDIAAVLPHGHGCRRPVTTDALSARRIELYADQRSTPASRFYGPEASFASADALTAHFDAWADAQPARCRLPPDGRAMVLRHLLAQRPLALSDAIETWYGAGKGDDAVRAVVMRPGMRVCVSDVVPTDVNFGRYALAGESCARLIQGPQGAMLDPVASRFTVPLISYDGDHDNAVRMVRSWAEIEAPGWSERSFVVVQPKGMPTVMPTGPDDAAVGAYSLLIIADPNSRIRVLPTTGGHREYPTVAGVLEATRTARQISEICATNADRLRCIRFGERGVYRVDLPITLNGAAIDVPVGTTLAGVVGMVAPDFAGSYLAGPAPMQEDAIAEDRRRRSYAKLKLHRWFDGRRVRVKLPTDPGDMPLQPGDRISW
jgi:hypothetical protein